MRAHLFAATLLVSGLAWADDDGLHFNHLGAYYLSSDIGDFSGDGLGGDVAFSITDYAFALAQFSNRSFDVNDSELDVEFFSAGLGGNWALDDAETIQIFGAATYEQIDRSGGSVNDGDGAAGDGSDDGDGGQDDGAGGAPGTPLDPVLCLLIDCGPAAASKARSKALPAESRLDGYGIQVGVRARVWQALELNAAYKFRDYDDTDETIYSLGAGYAFGDWVVTLNLEEYDEFDITDIYAGVRYVFKAEESGGFW